MSRFDSPLGLAILMAAALVFATAILSVWLDMDATDYLVAGIGGAIGGFVGGSLRRRRE